MTRTSMSSALRAAAAAATLVASLTLTGCGFDAQTLQPYTPAQGLNVDVAGGPKVRNLLVIANDAGKGRVSASLVSPSTADAITQVSANAVNPNLTVGEALTVGTTKIPLEPAKLVVLTGEGVPPITLESPLLRPGGTAQLRLTFASGVSQTIIVPVVDAKVPMYAAVAPELA